MINDDKLTNVIIDRFAGAGGFEASDTPTPKFMRLSGNMDCFDSDIWSGWVDQKIRTLENQLCTVVDDKGRLNIILRGTNNKFWQSSTCDNLLWGDWYTPGNITLAQSANMTSRFFAGRFGKDGQIVLFVLGADGHIWDFWSSSKTIHDKPWVFSQLPMKADPEFFAIERRYGGLEAFAIGLDNCVWHSWTKDYDNDAWSQWESLDGWAASGLFLANNSEGYPELLVKDPENALWTIRHYKDGWRGWTRLGGAFRGRAVSVINANGGMDVYGVGFDRKLYRVSRPALDCVWGDLQCLKGTFNHMVGGVVDDGGAKICMIGVDKRLWLLNGDEAYIDLGGNLSFARVDIGQDGRSVIVGCRQDGNVYCRRCS